MIISSFTTARPRAGTTTGYKREAVVPVIKQQLCCVSVLIQGVL